MLTISSKLSFRLNIQMFNFKYIINYMNSKEKLAKKLGITIEELEKRINKNKNAEEDLIESTAKKKTK